jgi:mono/diheme cytochrome c family protein
MKPRITVRTAGGLVALGVAVLLAVASWSGPTASAQDDAHLALGKRIYDETAGGVGCAYCHGLDGRGQGTAGVDAPDIVGVQEAALRSSLAGAVPLMNFITLTEAEFDAVLAYLAFLAAPHAEEPDAAGAEAPAADDDAPAGPEEGVDEPRSVAGILGPTGILSYNIAITDEGFSPSSISMPVGQMVQIVLRNRTFDEHHFRVRGLEVANLMWIANAGEQPPTDERDHHHGHGDHGDHDAAEAADHDDHDHPPSEFVSWRAESPSGIQPTGDEVHAWAYTYSPGGGRDVIIFTPLTTGTFVVDNPANPEWSAEIIVHD